MKLLLITILAFLVFAQTACQDSSKELELKQKELALKEKELDMKAKEKELNDKKQKANDKPTATPEKEAEPTEKKTAGSNGCALTNPVRFKAGTSTQTFKCDLATNNGNTKHRYTLQAEAGQDLIITFKSTDASYDFTDPDGTRILDIITSETYQFHKNGQAVVSVNLAPGATFGDYTINFEIR
jgi:hypothetical protein